VLAVVGAGHLEGMHRWLVAGGGNETRLGASLRDLPSTRAEEDRLLPLSLLLSLSLLHYYCLGSGDQQLIKTRAHLAW
jgi:pheromone shutdown protein TraB